MEAAKFREAKPPPPREETAVAPERSRSGPWSQAADVRGKAKPQWPGAKPHWLGEAKLRPLEEAKLRLSEKRKPQRLKEGEARGGP
jgi:hypothetical protein